METPGLEQIISMYTDYSIYFIITTAAITMFITFTGWLAALQLKECWIKIYLTILITISMLTLAGFIVVYFVDGDKIEKIMEKNDIVKNVMYDLLGEYDMTNKKNNSQEIDDALAKVQITNLLTLMYTRYRRPC